MNNIQKNYSIFNFICAGISIVAYISYFFKYIGSKLLEMASSLFGGFDDSFGSLFDVSSYFKAAFYEEYFHDGFFNGISDLMEDIFSIGSDEVLFAVLAVVAAHQHGEPVGGGAAGTDRARDHRPRSHGLDNRVRLYTHRLRFQRSRQLFAHDLDREPRDSRINSHGHRR